MHWQERVAALERVPARRLILALLALHVALHLPWIHLPPGGFHAWRQTQTLSIARNYAEEDPNLLYPRVDSRGPRTGITGLEFPIVYWTIGLGYRAFGEHDWVHRAAMLAWSAPAIPGAFLFGRALFGTAFAGLASGTLLVLSPLFLYYSFAALPDAPMLGFLLLGLAGLLAAARGGRASTLAWSLASLALAALLKLSAAAAAPAALLLLARGWRRFGARERVVAMSGSVGAVVIVAAWYLWARHLSVTHQNSDFLLALDFPDSPGEARAALRKVFVQWLPEVYLSYPEFGFFLIGLAALRRSSDPGLRPLLVTLTLGLAAFMIAFLPMLEIQDYYMMAALALLLPVATLGVLWAVRAAEQRRGWAIALAALAVATAIVGPYRGLSRFARTRVDADLATLAPALERAIPDPGDLVIVAEERSPSLYLYWARRKGWAAERDVPPARFHEMAAQSARWLVSDSRALEQRVEIRPWLVPAAAHGRFRVFRIAAPPDSSQIAR